jgi:hypothetical protein
MPRLREGVAAGGVEASGWASEALKARQPHVAHDDQFSGSHPTIEIEAP